jgi:hypothetical protein
VLDCRLEAFVDFTNFCPIRQQLMSNFLCAMRFSPLPGHRSTASADILAAIPTDAAPTTDDSPEQRLHVVFLSRWHFSPFMTAHFSQPVAIVD